MLTQFQILILRQLRWHDYYVQRIAEAETQRLMADGLSEEDARGIVQMHLETVVAQHNDEQRAAAGIAPAAEAMH